MVGLSNENQTAIAHANLISRLKRGRMVDAASVEIGSILRGDIMKFTAVAGMNDYRAMPTRNVNKGSHPLAFRADEELQKESPRHGAERG